MSDIMLAVLSIVSKLMPSPDVLWYLYMKGNGGGGGGYRGFGIPLRLNTYWKHSTLILCILGLRRTKPHNIERLQENKSGLYLK